MISSTLALCALLAPLELQDELQSWGPWAFRETTPETAEPRFGPSLEVLDPADGGVLARLGPARGPPRRAARGPR